MTHPSAQQDPKVVEPDQAVLDSLLTELHAPESKGDLSRRIADAVARGDAARAARRLAEAEAAQASDPVATEATADDLAHPQPLRSARRVWLSAAVVLLGFGAVLGTLLSDRGTENEAPGQNDATGRQDPQEGSARVVTSVEELLALLPEVTAMDVKVARRASVVSFSAGTWTGGTDPEDLATLASDLRVEPDVSHAAGMFKLPAFQSNSWLETNGMQPSQRVPILYYDLRLKLEDGSHIAALFGLSAQSERVHLMVRGMPSLVSVGPQAKERLASLAETADSLHGIIRKPSDFAAHRNSKELTLLPNSTRRDRIADIEAIGQGRGARGPADALPPEAASGLNQCSEVRRLDLSPMRHARIPYNKLWSTLFPIVTLRPTLEGLDLSGMTVTDGDFGMLSDLTALRDLDMSSVREFTGEAFVHYPQSALQRSDFRTIDLSSVPTLTDEGLAAIAAWGVEDLRLAHSFGNITAEGWRALIRGPEQRITERHGGNPAPALTALDLSGWPLEPGQLMDLARHPTLERLQLHQCDLDDEDLAVLAAGLAGGRVRQLSIANNPRITSTGIAKLEALDDLEVISNAGSTK